MESTYLLGSKKKVKIHPHAVTAQYARQPSFSSPPSTSSPRSTVHTHFPQPGDEGYDDAPSFEDFGSFLDETSDRKRLTEGRKWPGRTLFGGGKERIKDTPLRSTSTGLDGAGGGAGGEAKGVGEQLASFGVASAAASRLTWVGLLAAATAGGGVAAMTHLSSEHFGMGPFFLLLVRCIFQLASLVEPLRRGEHPLGPEGHRLRLVVYGVAWSLSLCCAYASPSFLGTQGGDDAALTVWRLATTILSGVLVFLLLEERLGLADGTAVVVGVCGLGLALIPDMDQSDDGSGPDVGKVAAREDAATRFWRGAFGWSLAALAGLWMALALVAYRSMKERVGVSAALLAVSWTGCLAATASMGLLKEGPVWPSGAQAWGLLLGVVACAMAAFVGVTHALSRIHPTLVSAAQSIEVPVAMLLQLVVSPPAVEAPPTVCQVAGGVVVAVSVVLLVAMKLLPSRSGPRRQREEYEEILDSPIK